VRVTVGTHRSVTLVIGKDENHVGTAGLVRIILRAQKWRKG